MSNSKKNQNPPHNSGEPDFDPTRLEGGGQSGELAAAPDLLPASISHFIPTERDLSVAAHQAFGGDLPDATIRKIIAESEEIAHSTRKIFQEHMRMGGNFLHIMTTVHNHMVAQLGDKKTVRDKASNLVYTYLQRVFRHSPSTIKLYIKCYEKFINNSEAVQILSLGDMSLLVASDIGDDVIDMVIDEKSKDPTLSKRDAKKLIDNYKQARDQVAESNTRVEVVTNELSNAVGELDEARLENKRLAAERDTLRQQIDRDKESAEVTKTELKNVSQSVSRLQQEIAKRERELETAARQLKEASSKVETRDVPVPTVPEGYKNLQEAMQVKLNELDDVSKQLEEKQRELSSLSDQLVSQSAEIEAQEAVEKQMSDVLRKFGEFTQSYHTAQLMVTAGRDHGRFVNVFEALGELVGKFHTELLAASRAA
jgi:myosin heavy subunit